MEEARKKVEELLRKYGLFDVEAEARERSKLNESSAFTGYARRHPIGESQLILVVSEVGEPLVTLEFSVADVLRLELLEEKEGKVRIWVRSGAEYMQCSYLTVRAAPVPEIPGIRRVFRGEAVEEEALRLCGCSCGDCGCYCDCNCPAECTSNEDYVAQRGDLNSSQWRSQYSENRNTITKSIRLGLVK